MPEQNHPILDMMPRFEIMEDQVFRKQIPKSTRLHKRSKILAEGEDM